MMFRLPQLSAFQTLVYLAAAVVPAIILMVYIYRKDRYEKEPGKMLMRCVLGGCLSALAAIVLETASDYLENLYFSSHAASAFDYAVITAALVGLIEEGTKFFFLKKFTWKSPEFNWRFDGMVYAVFVSLGFAALENVIYVFSYFDLSIALQRAILTIPAHMSFAVYMGMYYGRAKMAEVKGALSSSSILQWTAYLTAVFLHAVYDGALMVGSDASIMFFYGFVVLLDLFVISTIKRESRTDGPIY
ncbi:MAG: PrsW family intramembrane metalloprotease [Solobacterium sp.]|nr:PrsW family intramembrane metalloprotease [Solobacterium sp.]